MKAPRARLGWWIGAGLVLALVFASYLNPHFAVDLANKVWSCF